jgi:hypothetical protein
VGQSGFADPRRPGDEGVAAGEQGGEKEIGRLLGTQDRGVEFCAENLEGVVWHGKGFEGSGRNDEG